MTKLLILDSGHNEYVKGKESKDKSLREWDWNNRFQIKLKARAEAHGILVYLTNPSPSKKDEIGLSTRCKLANNHWVSKGKPSSLFLSIHGNAASVLTARGVEVFTSKKCSSNSTKASKLVCNYIYKDISKLDSKFRNRGPKQENYSVLTGTSMPAILVENAFYSNIDDLKLMKNNLDSFVEANLKGVCEYFSIKYTAPTVSKPSTSTSNTYYRVVCGFFTSRDNANIRVNEIKKRGYEPFLVPHTSSGNKGFRVIAVSDTSKSYAESCAGKLKDFGAFVDIYKA